MRFRLPLILVLSVSLNACLVGVVDTAVDTTVAVAKLPLKVAGGTAAVLLPEGKSSQEEKNQDDD